MTSFQTLPSKVVTLIVNYLAFGSTHPSNMSCITNEHVNKQTLQSLIEAGSIWCQAALECVYSRCEIKMGLCNTFNSSFPLAPGTNMENIKSVEPYITNLQIKVSYNVLASLDNVLATAWKSLLDKKLNNVKHLEIVFLGKDKYGNSLQVSPINIANLAQVMQYMVPSPTQVDVKYGVPGYPLDSDACEKIGSVFNVVYPKGNTHAFTNLDYAMSKLNLQRCTGLTSITIKWNDIIESRLKIVHVNADMLQTLSVQCKEGDPLDQLFINSSQEIIEYPQLQKLELISGGSHKGSTFVHIEVQGAPFPSLRHLNIDMVYPFTNDVLFRGNNQTLEYLNIKCSEETLEMFTNCGTFAKCKLVALKELHIHPVCTSSSTNIPPVELAQLAFGTAPSAEHITIKGGFANTRLFEHMPSNIQMKHMTKLSVRSLTMDFCDLMFVLSGIPALEELECEELVLGDDLHSYSHDKQIEYVLENCYLLGEHFSKVNVGDHSRNTKDKATALMLTAIMCPQFTSVYMTCLYADDCQKYQDFISTAKHVPPFDKFKSQIDRIIITPNSCFTECYIDQVDDVSDSEYF